MFVVFRFNKVTAAIMAAAIITILAHGVRRAAYAHPSSKLPVQARQRNPSGKQSYRQGPKGMRRLLINESKIVDLTYSFDENTIYWPTAKPFRWEQDAWGMTPAGYWYASASYAASEHGGTHLDSPIHFAKGQATTDQLPLSRLIGPAVVIDITSACLSNADYQLRVADITAWERQHGRIPESAIVLVRTGWGRFWANRTRYLGTNKLNDASDLHFPGISREAAEFLAQRRRIDGVGIDTASLDYGASKDFIAHQVLNAANIYGLENIANLERVPPTGATLVALPMKIRGGTGGPVRIIAILP